MASVSGIRSEVNSHDLTPYKACVRWALVFPELLGHDPQFLFWLERPDTGDLAEGANSANSHCGTVDSGRQPFTVLTNADTAWEVVAS